MIKIKIVNWSNKNINDIDENIDFYLEQDGWNDYWYFTAYYLHIGKKLTGTGNEFVGFFRIQRIGQEKDEKYLLKENTIINELPKDFVSHTSDINFYKKLNEKLNQETRKNLANALNFVVLDPEKYLIDLKDDECFHTSLLIGSGININDAEISKQLLLSQGILFHDLQNISINLTGIEGILELSFDVKKSAPKDLMPNRMCVLVGRNGCGKSTVIYKLCKLFYADLTIRDSLNKEIGELFPRDIFFSKIILFSYSALDNFTLSMEFNSDLNANIIDGRFIYCGLRDTEQEKNELIKSGEYKKYKNNICSIDRLTINTCKTVDKLSREFANSYISIHSDPNKRVLFDEIVKILIVEDSISDIFELFSNINNRNDEELSFFFMNLSTGHKFVLHSLFHLILYIQPSCLAVFDEPENHLHPPLLVVYMEAARHLLRKQNAVMFVATHSPIVLQETLSNNVIIVRKTGKIISLDKPSIQTFGENLDNISAEIFGLTPAINNYKGTLNNLLDHAFNDIWNYEYLPPEDILDKISNWFENGLSNQSTAYVANKILRKITKAE